MRSNRWIAIGLFLLLSVTVSALATEESQLVTRCKEMVKIYLAGQAPVPEGIQLILGRSEQSATFLSVNPHFSALKKSAAEDVQTTIKQEWKSNDWVNKSKTVTLWDNPWTSKEFITSTESHWVDGHWVNVQRYRSDYCSSGSNYTMFFELWQEGQWQPKEKISYEYENGRLARQILQISSDPGSWRDKEKIENRYDDNGFRKNYSLYMWNGIGLEEMEMYVYKNNERGQPIEERWYWVLDNRYNNCVWDTMYMNMKSFKYLKTSPYSILEKTFLWDYNNPRQTTLYTYADQASWLIEVLEKSKHKTNTSDPVWYNERRTTNHYSTKLFDNGSLTYMDESIQQVCNDGVWSNAARQNINVTNINPNYTSETISQIWTSGWQNSERQLYIHKMAETSGVADRMQQAPESLTLSNYPNPFNPSTTLSFTLPETDEVTLRVFDVRGQWITTLLKDAKLSAGEHQQVWDGRDWRNQTVSSGVYFIQLENGAYRKIARGLLIK